MKKEWYTAKELVGLAGLPNSPQGVNLMARREGWENRRKRGVQGKAVEYSVKSLPEEVVSVLAAHELLQNIYLSVRMPFLSGWKLIIS